MTSATCSTDTGIGTTSATGVITDGKDLVSLIDKFPSETYRGTFTSTYYMKNVAKGEIQAFIDFKQNTAKFRLIYTGLYNGGKIHRFTAIINRGKEDITFEVKADVAGGKQKIDFKVNKIDIDKLSCSGEYTSFYPEDGGTWELTRSDFDYDNPPKIDTRSSGGEGCNIM